MKSTRFSQLASSLILSTTLLVTGCGATEVPANWKPECVGRMQLSLPQDVEVATNSLEEFKSHYLSIGFESASLNGIFKFSDGQQAGIRDLSQLRFISGKLNSEQIVKLRQQFWASFESRQAKAKQSSEDRLKNSKYKLITRGEQDMDAYGVRNITEHLSLLNGHAVSYTLDDAALNPIDEDGKKRVTYQEFRANLRARDLFHVPSEQGLCFPYVFLKDSGQQTRHVAASYQLKKYPDVTITFSDSAGRAQNETLSAAQEVGYFWSRYNNVDPKKSSIKIAQFDGAASHSEFTRDDGSKDFGYYAYVKGDDSAIRDSPTLRLEILRNAKYAKGAPISRAEFQLLTEQITTSVKYRAPGPVVNPIRSIELKPASQTVIDTPPATAKPANDLIKQKK